MGPSDRTRVIISGVGILSCFGVGAPTAWRHLLTGRSGVTAISQKIYEKFSSRVYGKVPWTNEDQTVDFKDVTLFDPSKYAPKAEQREIGPAGLYAICAAEEALRDAQWFPQSDQERERTGTVIGTGMCDMRYVEEASLEVAKANSYNRLSPYFIPRVLLNTPAAHVSIRFGLRGLLHSSSTACAIGAHAVGDAFRLIRNGDCDVVVAGGCEANLNPLTIAGFSRMRALSTKFNETPSTASRPFDTHRDGFVIAEGAACLVLESLDHFRQRCTKYQSSNNLKHPQIYGEILGYGLSADAHHISAPPDDGNGARRSMQSALKDARLLPSDVTHISCHATSTQLGDLAEIRAICDLYRGDPSSQRSLKQPSQVLINSTKGATGHLLGAAGAIECAFTALECQTGIVAPSVNARQIDPKIVNLLNGLNAEIPQLKVLIANCEKPTEWRPSGGKRRIALKNSFGFGGTNATLCLANFEDSTNQH